MLRIKSSLSVSLRASSAGRSGGGAEKGRRACNYVSGIWIPPPILLWLPADWVVSDVVPSSLSFSHPAARALRGAYKQANVSGPVKHHRDWHRCCTTNQQSHRTEISSKRPKLSLRGRSRRGMGRKREKKADCVFLPLPLQFPLLLLPRRLVKTSRSLSHSRVQKLSAKPFLWKWV